MDRLVSVLLLVLIVAVLGVGLVVYRADQQAREYARQLNCLERTQAIAAVTLLAPADKVDKKGRLEAMRVLGQRVDTC